MRCSAKYISALLITLTFAAGLLAQSADRTIATFDDSPAASVSFIVETPDPFFYQGLVWRGFSVIQSNHQSLSKFPRSGYRVGAVSGNFAAVAAGRAVSESTIERKGGGRFVFYGAHLTAAWRTGLNVTFEGLRGENVVFTKELVANTTDAVHLSGAWEVETLRIRASGGSDGDVCPPMDCYPGPELLVDDLSYSFSGRLAAPAPVEPAAPSKERRTSTPHLDHPTSACEIDPHYGVQVGAFSTAAIARTVQTQLGQLHKVTRIYIRHNEGAERFHLVVGCGESRSDVLSLAEELRAAEEKGIIVEVARELFGEPL